METRDFSLAGWLSIFSALLVVPVMGLGFLAGFESDLPGDAHVRVGYGGAMLEIGSFLMWAALTAASVWLYLELRRLLNRSGFHGIDTLVPILIVLEILVLFIPDSWLVITLPLYFIACAVSVVFGIRLLQFYEDPTGLVKPLAYLLMATFICMATLILVPLSILLFPALYIVQAMIFFRAEEFSEASAEPNVPPGIANYAG